jgi:protein involved in polysaccharide export with SLBB domain
MTIVGHPVLRKFGSVGENWKLPMRRFDLIGKFLACAAFILFFGALALPAGAQDAAAPAPVAAPQADAAAPVPALNEDYTLGTGDKVRIVVFGEDDLGGEFEVDGSGYVRLPLIGQVKALGLSLRGFEAQVKAALDDGFMKDARVSVTVAGYRPFYIIGEVNKPGEYPYVNNMSVLNAIALAGGFTYRANQSDVYIQRNGGADEVAFPADQNTKVFPGDVVRVRERFF